MKKIFLIDVSSLFFRAFYAVRPLTSPSGLPTNAIYGFLSMILKLLKDEKPEYLVFCYDRKDPSFRKDIYPEYKANRSEMPEDLVPQIPYIKKLANLLGIPSVEVEKFEADDLIGTLVKLGLKNQMEVLIMSGDKDFAQLVEDRVYLYDSMKGTKLGPAGVVEKWGVAPEKFIDYLALVGDASDNIPGVRGIGPKGAQKLLEEFGSLEGIYQNIESIKGALKDKLSLNKENAFLSRQLVTIVTDVPLNTDMKTYRRLGFQRENLIQLFEELNFKNFEKNLWALDHTDSDFNSVLTPSLQASMVEQSDISSLNRASSEQNIEIKNEKKESFSAQDQSEEVQISELTKKIAKGSQVWALPSELGFFLGLEKENKIYRIGGDLSDLGKVSDQLELSWKGFDLKSFWHQIGIEHPRASWDAMLAAYVLRPGENLSFSKVLERFTQRALPDLANGNELLMIHLELEKSILEKIHQYQGNEVYQNLDLPLAAILYRMEKRGIKLDCGMLANQSQELSHLLNQIEAETYRLAGESFNIASPKQLAVILFDKLKLPTGRKTKTGYSTDNEVLEKLKSQHPLVEQILQYRELAKLKSTYVDSLPNLVGLDGRIHTHFNQALTTTGRLSSTDPNLQNIPIRTERGARVRKAFVADKNMSLLSVDYSQIELRVLAHFSEDPYLIKAFQDDLDIHSATASEVFSVPLNQVNSDQRRAAKAVNFGIAYGQGAFGLAENLGISRSEAADIIKRYFSRFSRVQNYIEETIALAQKNGFVETLAGRRRYIEELKSQNPNIRKFGERAAINAPIQGTASDIVRKAMLQIDQQVSLPMLLQVHDELIFEGPDSQVHQSKGQIVQIMESVVKLNVPLKANAAIGPSWDEAK